MPEDRAQGLSVAELNAQQATDLPDREAMSLLDTSLLNLNVNLDATVNAAAPIDAAVAANANVAAPIDASVSANIASNNSLSMASAQQDSVIVQDLDGVATATANQDAAIGQGGQ